MVLGHDSRGGMRGVLVILKGFYFGFFFVLAPLSVCVCPLPVLSCLLSPLCRCVCGVVLGLGGRGLVRVTLGLSLFSSSFSLHSGA